MTHVVSGLQVPVTHETSTDLAGQVAAKAVVKKID